MLNKTKSYKRKWHNKTIGLLCVSDEKRGDLKKLD